MCTPMCRRGLTVSVARTVFDMEPADHPVLDEALFAGYVAGLREALHPQVGTCGGDGVSPDSDQGVWR